MPEKAKLAFQSSKRGAAWPGRELVARVNFLWGCWGSERPRAGRSRVVAARRGEVSPEQAVPVFSRGYSIPNRAQKVRGKVLTLTRGS